MEFKKLKEFIEIAKEAGATKLEYSDGDKNFAISFQNESSGQVMTIPAQLQGVSSAPVAASAQQEKPNAAEDGLLEVTSPFVGTFYAASSPDTPPYVKVGDRVSKGQVLCIVEAMKIMNEIESDFAGEVVSVCVENESYVEFGQALFKIRP